MRRHTRSLCDWSSDVSSSDLNRGALFHAAAQLRREKILEARKPNLIEFQANHDFDGRVFQFRVLAQRQGHILADSHRTEIGRASCREIGNKFDVVFTDWVNNA